jgi:hypothetical protein
MLYTGWPVGAKQPCRHLHMLPVGNRHARMHSLTAWNASQHTDTSRLQPTAHMCVVKVPLESSAAGRCRPGQWHQAARGALSACRLDACSPRPQQAHQVAVTPQGHVEVSVAVQRVEVGQGVVQTATQSTCKQFRQQGGMTAAGARKSLHSS